MFKEVKTIAFVFGAIVSFIAITTHGFLEYKGLFLLLSLFSLTAFIRLERFSLKLSPQDYCFTLFLLYIVLRNIVSPQPSAGVLYWAKWLLCAYSYYLSRTLSNSQRRIVFPLILFTGLVEIIVCFLQLLKVIPSNNQYFPLTGTFDNPAHAALFLSLIPIIVTYYIKDKRLCLFVRFVLVLFGILSVLLMVVCKSRAAIIITILGLGLSLISGLRIKRKIVMVSCLFVCLIGASYYLRPNSSNARILIWEASIQSAIKSPIIGLGNNSFQSNYMDDQARYFVDNNDSELTLVANNNYQAFNELLHIFYEHGLLGLVLVVAGVLLSLFSQSRIEFILSTMLLVSAQFLYVLDIPAIYLLLSFFLGSTSNNEIMIRRCCLIKCYIFVLTISIWSFIGYNYMKFKQADNYIEEVLNTKKIQQISADKEAVLLRERSFALRYSELLNSDTSVHSLRKAMYIAENIIVTTDMLEDIGDRLYKDSCYSEAVCYYQWASKMIPSVVSPKWKLFLLYKAINDFDNASIIAREIINSKYKKVGSTVLRAKVEARKFILEYNRSNDN